MESNPLKMAAYCRSAAEKISGNIFFAGFAPRCCNGVNNYNRFIFCLEGRKHIIYGDGEKLCDQLLLPGDAVFVPGNGEEEEKWDLPHTMISCVFMSSYTRVIYIDHCRKLNEKPVAKCFYHIPKEYISGDSKIAEAILELKGDAPEISRQLLRTLLELITDSLCKIPAQAPRSPEWGRICDAMHNLFRGDITRADVAEFAGVTPSQLSRIILKNSGKSFREMLNDHRLEYALGLLQNSSMPIGEIASSSGFSYTSYFIRLFHERYGVSPEHFRKAHFTLPKNENRSGNNL